VVENLGMAQDYLKVLTYMRKQSITPMSTKKLGPVSGWLRMAQKEVKGYDNLIE
jgi:hypothetical protein